MTEVRSRRKHEEGPVALERTDLPVSSRCVLLWAHTCGWTVSGHRVLQCGRRLAWSSAEDLQEVQACEVIWGESLKKRGFVPEWMLSGSRGILQMCILINGCSRTQN